MPAKNSRQSRRPQAKTPLTVSHTTDVRSIWSQRSAQSTDARKRVYSLDEWNETLVEHYDVPTLPGGIAVIKRKIDSEIGSVEAKQNATPKVDGFVSAKTWITIEVKNMKTAGKLPARITDLAKDLADRMVKAAKTNKHIRPVTWQHIKNQLPDWDLWPFDKIK